MTKSKAKIMKQLRNRRRESGMVEFRRWVSREHYLKIADFIKKLENNEAK